MIRILIAALILFHTLPLMSQDADQAQKLIRKVSTKLQSHKSLQADFNFTLFNPEVDMKDTHKGSLLLHGSKYRLQLMGLLALCNGEALWSINQETKEVYLMDPEENELFDPHAIFNLVEKDFTYQWISQNGSQVTVDLVPRQTDSNYSKIRMVIDQLKEQILKATYFSDDGNQYIIEIRSLIFDPLADDSFFFYDKSKYPGFSLFDMR